MANTSIGTAWIQIKPSMEGISTEISKALSSGDPAGKFSSGFNKTFIDSAKQSFSQAFSDFADQSKQAWSNFKILASGAILGAAGAITYAVKQFADYEQLIGGVETLFKDSSSIVKNYAQGAYKTAQLSANRYMETITGFSASLLQGLGGDTAKAAKIGNMAVTDMADNANKMGTSMESIQFAYQGFAKDNFTMLDNLKLGYGGTQAEMARLINDSGVMGKTFKATATNVGSIPFDKVIEAIHEIQNRLDITGTSAKEASTTISGSFNTAKSAFNDMIVSLSDPNGNFDLQFKKFIDSGKQFLSNLAPVVKSIATTIFGEIKKQSPELASAIEGVAKTIENIFNFIKENQGTVITILQVVLAFKLLQVAVGGVLAVISTLSPIIKLVQGSILLMAAIANSSFVSMAAGWLIAMGPIPWVIAIIVGLTALIVANWQSISDFIGQVWSNIAGGASFVWNSIVAVFGGIVGWFTQIFQSAWDGIKSIFSGVGGFFRGVWDTIVGIFGKVGTAIGDAIGGSIKGVVNAIIGFAEGTINGFINAINIAIDVLNAIPGVKIGRLNLLNIPRLATGGPVFGPGTGTSDSVPAYLSNGEYVIKAAAAQKIGYDNLDKLNSTGSMSGSGDIYFTINGYNKDPDELADIISRKIALKKGRVIGG